METKDSLVIKKSDFQRLSALLGRASQDVADLLEGELSRASIVADEALPSDVVSMNSKVCFRDLESGKDTIVTLVYPSEANIEENKISVLAPVGSALIGLGVGQVIQWPMPNGKEKRFTIVSVLAQNESA